MRISVILTTYNQPRWLKYVLTGYGAQSCGDFEVVVADDGSSPETLGVVDQLRGELAVPVVHVWQRDEGFRKTLILNRAIHAARGDYLIFTDGDCVPRWDLVEVHASLAEEGRFLSGGYLKLGPAVSRQVTSEAVRSGEVFHASWLRGRGWKRGRRIFRLTRSRGLARFLDSVTPTRPTWNGHNASTWKEAVVEANGFDLDMGYGGLDRALGERLENLGVRGKQIRYRAPCLHLAHGKPYLDPGVLARNRSIRERIRDQGETRARRGLAELGPDPHLRISLTGRNPWNSTEESDT
jgi:glycosyltransferase involved in cell wall biosynthesis